MVVSPASSRLIRRSALRQAKTHQDLYIDHKTKPLTFCNNKISSRQKCINIHCNNPLKAISASNGAFSISTSKIQPQRIICTRATYSQNSPSISAAAAPMNPTKLEKIAEIGTMMFPIWALISATVAYTHPPALNWITNTQFEQGVGLLMLAMGLSLSIEDFKKCAANPVPILLGFLCQYSILPVLALIISRVMGLPASMSVGLILLGCCPGGQASNVATHVARGDVALSVLMTTASTIAAAVMTPLLASLLAGQFIPVDAFGLAESTVRLVLFPTLLGVALNELFPKFVSKIRPAMPLLALLLTVVLCAVPVSQVADILGSVGSVALLPVILLHGFGYFFGYILPRLLKFDERTSRTVSIETGMQSAAMGWALSTKHFSDIMVAVPSSVSIVVMVWMGALLASIWRMMPVVDKKK